MAIVEQKKDDKKVAKKVASPKTKTIVAAENAEIAARILVEPWITEKSHAAIADNKYTFRVTDNAAKRQVKMAIEGIYNVKVEKITAVNIHPKKKAYGRHMGKKPGIRKMTVTLKKGDKIELFQGA
jgi:large subunit ribosomal protein L23